MPVNHLDILGRVDPEAIESLRNLLDIAFSEGAIPQKSRLSMAMVFDADHGALQEVTARALICVHRPRMHTQR